MLGDRLPEGEALERPVARDPERTLGGAAAAGGDEEALDEKPLLRAFVAAGRHAVPVRHAAVAENELRMMVEVGIRRKPGTRVELRARSPRLDDEQRLLAVDDREHDVEALVALARHEPLLAVENPLVAVAGTQSRPPRSHPTRRPAR